MKHNMCVLAPVFCLLAASLIGQKNLPPDVVPPDFSKQRDVLRLVPGKYSEELNNERLRVLRLKLKGNEAVPLHDDEEALVICLTKECRLRLATPGGRTEDINMAGGTTRWIYGDGRSERNLSNQELEMLFVEMKRIPAARSN